MKKRKSLRNLKINIPEINEKRFAQNIQKGSFDQEYFAAFDDFEDEYSYNEGFISELDPSVSYIVGPENINLNSILPTMYEDDEDKEADNKAKYKIFKNEEEYLTFDVFQDGKTFQQEEIDWKAFLKPDVSSS